MEEIFHNKGFMHIANTILSHLPLSSILHLRLVSTYFKQYIDQCKYCQPNYWLKKSNEEGLILKESVFVNWSALIKENEGNIEAQYAILSILIKLHQKKFAKFMNPREYLYYVSDWEKFERIMTVINYKSENVLQSHHRGVGPMKRKGSSIWFSKVSIMCTEDGKRPGGVRNLKRILIVREELSSNQETRLKVMKENWYES